MTVQGGGTNGRWGVCGLGSELVLEVGRQLRVRVPGSKAFGLGACPVGLGPQMDKLVAVVLGDF